MPHIVIEGNVEIPELFRELAPLESVVVENGDNPEKTDGVKRLMANVAREIARQFPGTRFGKTNLQDFL